MKEEEVKIMEGVFGDDNSPLTVYYVSSFFGLSLPFFDGIKKDVVEKIYSDKNGNKFVRLRDKPSGTSIKDFMSHYCKTKQEVLGALININNKEIESISKRNSDLEQEIIKLNSEEEKA